MLIGEVSASRTRIALTLALLSGAVFARTLAFEFVFDDVTYITANPAVAHGLTGESVPWAFTTSHGGHWHPITWLSHLVDIQIFGMKPAGHHLVNVLLHALNTILVFLGLDALTRRRGRSFVVAALFAVHPLHVETVAWVADRKDLLAGLFELLAVVAYLRYARGPRPGRYLLVVAAFAAGLMSKSMVATLPGLLLLLDACALGRWRWKPRVAMRLLFEKAPLVLFSAADAVATGHAAREAEEGFRPVHWPLAIQLANVPIQCATYIAKTIWPCRLAVLYPYETQPPGRLVLAGMLVLVIISAFAFRLRRTQPYLAAGWLWFLIGLTPVMGLVPGGPMSMGDRYMYLPVIGPLVIVVFGMHEWWDRVPKPGAARRRQAVRTAVAIGTAAIVCALAAASWVQTGTWRNSATLFTRAYQINRRNPLTEHNLAVLAAQHGDADGAMKYYREALAIDPRFVAAHHNLGVHLAARGRYEEAAAEYRAALAVKADAPMTIYNLAGVLAKLERTDEAIAEYREVIRLAPNFSRAHNNLGAILLKAGRKDEAIAEYREALRLEPTSTLAWQSLQDALAERPAGAAPPPPRAHAAPVSGRH